MTLVLWLLAALCCGQLGPVGVVALPALPEECAQDWWVDFLQVTQNICREGKTCMNHPLINEKATGALVQALSFNGAACARGLGSAAAFVLRSISNRLKNVALVDVNLDARGEATVVLAISVWEKVEELNFPLDFSFEPFPYDVLTLLPFRVRTWHALAQLYSGAGRVLTASGIPHFAWLGGMRFWSELAGALVEVHRMHEDVFPVGAEVGPEHWNRMLTLPLQEYTMDIVVPAELEEKLLSLNLDFELHGKHHTLERLFLHSVEKGRLAQIVTNNFPEFGQGIDVRHLCPNCVVLNVFFYSEFEEEGVGRFLRISAHAEPCVANRGHVFPLARADEVTGFPLAFKGRLGTGLMPNWGLYILAHGWASFFEITSEAPCSWDLNQQPDSPAALAEEAQLGPVSAFVAASLGPEALGVRPGAVPPPAGGNDAQGLPGVLASTDFSAEGVLDLPEGAKGWFGFMEMRLSSKRPALQGFQQKIWMKSLMSERGVPIPRLLHTSEDSPRLPFEGPDLPMSERGFCTQNTSQGVLARIGRSTIAHQVSSSRSSHSPRRGTGISRQRSCPSTPVVGQMSLLMRSSSMSCGARSSLRSGSRRSLSWGTSSGTASSRTPLSSAPSTNKCATAESGSTRALTPSECATSVVGGRRLWTWPSALCRKVWITCESIFFPMIGNQLSMSCRSPATPRF